VEWLESSIALPYMKNCSIDWREREREKRK